MRKLNRREAFGALLGAATVTRIPAAALKPTDMIVISFPGRLSIETVERLKSTAQWAWPNQKVIVLGDGGTVQVVAGT